MVWMGSVFYVCASDWDLEYWQYWNLTNWQCGKYRFYSIGEARLNRHLSKFYYMRLAGNFAYSPFTFLDLEAHYSYIHSKSRGAKNFTVKSRYELEINPVYTFQSGVELRWRNRLEMIKKQAISEMRWLFRHRLMMVFPLENCGRLKTFYMFDEVVYDFNMDKFIQNRFTPIGVHFDLGRGNSMEIFFQIRNFHSYGQWYRSFDLASQIFF